MLVCTQRVQQWVRVHVHVHVHVHVPKLLQGPPRLPRVVTLLHTLLLVPPSTNPSADDDASSNSSAVALPWLPPPTSRTPNTFCLVSCGVTACLAQCPLGLPSWSLRLPELVPSSPPPSLLYCLTGWSL